MSDENDQSELGEKGIKALAAERDARKAAEKSLADMAAQLEAIKAQHAAEFETLQAQHAAEIQQQEAATAAAALDAARQTIFRAKGFPAELEKYVTGNSAEELAASADAVLADFGASHTSGQGAGEPAGSRPLMPPDPSLGASGAEPKPDPLSDDPFAKALKAFAKK